MLEGQIRLPEILVNPVKKESKMKYHLSHEYHVKDGHQSGAPAQAHHGHIHEHLKREHEMHAHHMEHAKKMHHMSHKKEK